MTYSTLSVMEAFDDLVELPDTLEQFWLTENDYEVASALINNWSSYIQALAILGFYGWLGDREPSLSLAGDPLSSLNPLYSQRVDAVFHLPVNGFQVCLLPCLSFSEDTIAIPRVIVELAEFTDQFYAIVALDESLQAIAVKGFLSYHELIALTAQTSPAPDWNYYLDIEIFHRDVDTLLLNLQCLAPEAIQRPIEPELSILEEYQQSLQQRLPAIKNQIQNRPLWQILTWEESISLWTYPELLQWLDSHQEEDQETAKTHLSDLLQLLIQPAIDVTSWLQNRAEELQDRVTGGGWNLIPATAFRRHLPLSPATDASNLLAEIYQETGVSVPSDAGRAYQDLNLGLGVRLYAITWCLSYEDSWTLLLILGTNGDRPLSSELGWRISDQTGILVEENVHLDRESSYLFTQVIGTYDEKFLVTLFSGAGTVMSLPPFSFPWGRLSLENRY